MFQWIIEKFLVRYKQEVWFKLVATVLMALILGLEYGVQNGLISGTAEWFARTIQVAAIVKAFLSQVDWELPTNGPDLPKGFWSFIPIGLITL